MKKQPSSITHFPPDNPGRKTVAVYARTDSDDSYMLAAQIRELSGYAAAHPDFTGWNITAYQDTGSFSRSGTPPRLEKLLEDIRSGEVHCVIIKNLSRIVRDQVALIYYMEHVFSACGVRLIALTEHLDTSDPATITLLHDVLYKSQNQD